jgi:DNA-binding winged helix-turn-helix (wHTH) protein/TolB-like protein
MNPTVRLRFGIFEFDPTTSELWRDGLPVRLQAQPAQVLALLLANAGETVSRDSLRRAVWGEATFVDFDGGLNFCVAQIRSALGDSAESPRFVRTVPKRGYQFIAPVNKPSIEVPPPVPSTEPPSTHLRFRRAHLVTALLLGAASLALVGIRVSGSRPLSGASLPNIAVVHYDNQTGNPELDRFADALTDAVVAELTTATSGRYAIIGSAAILRQPRDLRDLSAIAASLHARYVVLGQVQPSPAGVRILAHLIRVPEQTHLWVARVDSRTEALPAIRIVTTLVSHLPASDPAGAASSPAPIH